MMEQKVSTGRVVSLDALRGFDMFWIIGGGAVCWSLQYLGNNSIVQLIIRQMHHCEWNGFTFWDLIFPLFLFIVGVSMCFSFAKRLERGESRSKLYLHVVKRTILLFILGVIYNGGFRDYPPLSGVRFPGVLQRIGVCYFFASIVMLNTKRKGQAIIAGVLLLFYWGIMKLVPVPGHGAGVLTPEGNLAFYIDRHFLLGRSDPEGFLSTIPAISTTLIGLLTGHWIRSSFSKNKKALGLLGAGIVMLILGRIWNLSFPINKTLWTSSYVLYAAGWSLLLLCFFYWLIDVRGYRKWAFPFVVIGMNSIGIYMLHNLVNFHSIAVRLVRGLSLLGPLAEALSSSICVIVLEWLLLFWMYRRRIFIKI